MIASLKPTRPKIMHKPPSNKGRNIVRVNAMSFAQLIKYMNEGLYSCKELADLTGLHYVTVLEYTRSMYKAGAVHIGAWEADCRGRHMIKVYHIGPGKDAKRQKISASKRSLAYRVKQKQLDIIKRLHTGAMSEHQDASQGPGPLGHG